jgi:hypothetical protein
MKQREQDHDLAPWLDAYTVDDIDPRSRDALLDRIVAAALAPPRQTPKPFFVRFFQAGGIMADVAAMAAAAFIGFWAGTGTLVPTASQKTTVIQQADNSGSTYLENMVFGVTSWKEIQL